MKEISIVSPELIPDTYNNNSCQKKDDDNTCIESCIQNDLNGKNVPNYSVDLSHGQNCQTYANIIVNQCEAQCAGGSKAGGSK